MDKAEFIRRLMELVIEADVETFGNVYDVQTFEDYGVLTCDKGFVVRMMDDDDVDRRFYITVNMRDD